MITTKQRRNKGRPALWLAWFALFLCCAIQLPAQTVMSAWTATNGGILYVSITNKTTNLPWSSFGLGPDNQWTGKEDVKVKLTVTGNGFSEAGAVQTSKARTLIGTSKFPGLFPATNIYETSADGFVTVIQIAMSDFVFIGETVTMDLGAGLYDDNTAATGMSVTNNSFLNYTNARPVFNWLTPQFARSTGSTYRVEFLACHWSSIYDNSGRPLQAIEVRASDENANSVTSILTGCFFDYNEFGVGGARYAWNIPTGSFNDTNIITVNARTLPFFGTNAIVDTSDGLYTAPSPNYCPLKFLNDPNGTYGDSYCNVSTNYAVASDATGVVTNFANWTTNLTPFLTLRGAANGVSRYNSNFFGRNEVGGGHIYLEAGGHRMGGTNLTVGSRARTYLELLPYPGLQRTDAFLYTNHLSTDLGMLVKCSGLTLKGEAVGSAIIFSVVDCLWTDDCEWATGQSAPLNVVTNWYSTRDRFYRMASGINMAFSASGGAVFIRDGLFSLTNTTTSTTPILFRMLKTNTTGGASITFRNANAATVPARPSTIWAYNQWYGITNTSQDVWTITRDGAFSDSYIGQAYLCNVVESIGATPSAFLAIGAGGSTSNMINVMLFNNTILNKVNWFYDDGGTSEPRVYSPSWSIGNYVDDTNIKGDAYGSDAGRFGNRPQVYNVGFNHNILPETWNIGTPESFQQGVKDEAYGANSWSTNTSTTNILFQFTRRGSYTTVPGIGNGNYRYLTPSPAFRFVGPRVLSHKSDGITSAIDPSGSNKSGNAKYGGLF